MEEIDGDDDDDKVWIFVCVGDLFFHSHVLVLEPSCVYRGGGGRGRATPSPKFRYLSQI